MGCSKTLLGQGLFSFKKHWCVAVLSGNRREAPRGLFAAPVCPFPGGTLCLPAILIQAVLESNIFLEFLLLYYKGIASVSGAPKLPDPPSGGDVRQDRGGRCPADAPKGSARQQHLEGT
jgi:hypothetical protein